MPFRSLRTLARGTVATGILVVAPHGVRAQPTVTPAPWSPLAQTIDSLRREARVPGLAIALVRADGTVWLQGFGVASLADSTPVDPSHTRFRIGSIAKLFVAASVSQQVSAGRLHLDSAVSRYLPGLIATQPGEPAVTLRHLLTHSAGFEDRLIGYAARDLAAIEPLATHLARRLPQRVWPVGQRFAYSNYGVGVAALAVAQVTGTEFAQYAHDALFAPLGMPATSYLRAEAPLATGYRCRDDAPCTPAAPVISHVYPVGLAFSTASDLSRFTRMLLDGARTGQPIAGIDVQQMLAREAPGTATRPATSLVLQHGSHGAWSTWGHGGSVPGFTSTLMVVPDAGVGLVVLANASAPRLMRTVAEHVLDDALRGLPAPTRAGDAAVTPAAGAAAAAVGDVDGVYLSARRAMSTIERFPGVFIADKLFVAADSNGQIRVRLPNGDRVRLHAVAGAPFATHYADSTGRQELFVEREARTGRALWVTMGAPALGLSVLTSYQRLAWHETPYFLNEYASYLAIVPVLLTLVCWPLVRLAGGWYDRRRGRNARPVWSRQAAPALLAAGTYALLFPYVIFQGVAKTNRQLESLGDIVYGPTPMLLRLRMVPWLLAAFAAVLIAWSARSWARREWATRDRVVCSGVALCAALGVAFLWQWNLLPMRW